MRRKTPHIHERAGWPEFTDIEDTHEVAGAQVGVPDCLRAAPRKSTGP
jgi:hypothetical protein